MTNSTAALPNESAIVSQCAVDTSAFAVLYDHYFPRVYNYIRYRVQDKDVTDDVTAQVFERALANIESYQPEKAPFAAWLFALARNAVNDYLRAQMRRRWLSLEVVSNWMSSDPQPGEIVAGNETRHQLLVALNQLSHRERDLIALKFAGGLTNRRIATLTGISESNVGVILYRAMRKLRNELTAQGVER